MSAEAATGRPDARTSDESHDLRPPYGAAALAGVLVFALYAITLGPTTAFWDTSEYIATGHILGIPHPPGNPLFVVLARAWSIMLAQCEQSESLRSRRPVCPVLNVTVTQSGVSSIGLLTH